jgi:anti-sigma regulatory factor (Ser/Thr protein kinase)
MSSDTKHLEMTLETQVESVNLAEEMCLRVAEAAGFGEDDCYRIGMSVREGVINAFHYGNKERPDKKIHLAVDLTADKMIIHVLDEGPGFKLWDILDARIHGRVRRGFRQNGRRGNRDVKETAGPGECFPEWPRRT